MVGALVRVSERRVTLRTFEPLGTRHVGFGDTMRGLMRVSEFSDIVTSRTLRYDVHSTISNCLRLFFLFLRVMKLFSARGSSR